MDDIKVISHINPDTDAVCATIAYSWYLREIQKKTSTPYISSPVNREAEYVLKRFGFEMPAVLSGFSAEDKVAIVDTNNPEELLPGIDSAEIVEIIDHHKLFGGLKTNSPINITIKPSGSTSTVLWTRFKAEGIDVPANVLSILISGILSDTLNQNSPTTTQADKDAISEMKAKANIDSDELAEKMFDAKSDITGLTADDLLHFDSKVFTIEGKKLRISTIETTRPQKVLELTSQLKDRMLELKKEEGLDGIFLYITDIIYSYSEALAASDWERSVISKAHNVDYIAETVNLPGIVSRKKQILPAIENALKG